MKIALGISGASGAVYAKRLIEYLDNKHELFVTISKTAKSIFKEEIGIEFDNFIGTKNVNFFDNGDFYTPISSGSFRLDACVIAPCSMKTLSAIANGYSDSLITRCSDIAIKQKEKLIIVPRETPLSAIHLENMLKLSRLNASIVVPSPAFYGKPTTLQDAVDFVVGKILDELGIENNLYIKWGERLAKTEQ